MPDKKVARNHPDIQMQTPSPSRRRTDRLPRFSWLPIPIFLALIAFLSLFGRQLTWEPYYLMPVLNLVFSTGISLFIAYVAARTYLAQRSPAVLLMGCAVLAFGLISAVSAWAFPGRSDVGITVYNLGVLFAGLCHLLSAVIGFQRSSAVKTAWKSNVLWAYTSVLLATVLVTVASFDELIPDFYTSRGSTPTRDVVLGSAVACFALAGALFLRFRSRFSSPFAHWYGLGLSLIAVGLTGVMITEIGNPVAWCGRLAQYLGNVYLLAAIWSADRESGTWKLSLEQALYEVEYRYRTLVEMSPDAITAISDGKFVFANGAAVRLLGAASAEELLEREVALIIHPDSMERYRELQHQAEVERRSVELCELKLVSQNGGIAYIEAAAIPIDFQGRAAVQVIARDITRRKEAEAALLGAKERTKTILDTIRDGYVSLDREWRAAYVNNRALEMTNAAREDLEGRSFWELTPELVGTRLEDYFKQAMFDRIPSRFEFYNERRERWFDNSVYPSDDGIVFIFSDITDRKRAEQALKESEESARATYEQAAIGIERTDFEGHFLSANPKVCQMLGYSEEELKRFSFTQITHPDDLIQELPLVKSLLKGDIPSYTMEKRYLHRDGRPVWVRTTSSVARTTKPYRISIIEDIGDRKRAEEAMREARADLERRVRERTSELAESNIELQRRAEQLSRLASELTLVEQRERRRLAQLLHDHLQQLLVGAKFGVSALGRRVNNNTDRQAVEKVDELLDQSIKASRSLTVELSPPVLHAAGLGAALEWLARWTGENRPLKVTYDIDPEVTVDREDVKLLLFDSTRELLLNIIKHAGTNQAKIELRVNGQEEVQVVVSDDGVGFNPVAVREKTREQGGGFGLFSIEERIRLAGGRLLIESVPGKGSRFTLAAPRHDVKSGKPSAEGSRAHAERPEYTDRVTLEAAPIRDGQKVRILLVDDHVVMRQGLSALLRQEIDMEVVGEASDGEEAVEMADRMKPDMILMDVSMPRMSGVQATRIIHRQLPGIRIIGLSMFEEADCATSMFDAGATAYVTKSGRPNELLSAVRACVTVPQRS